MSELLGIARFRFLEGKRADVLATVSIVHGELLGEASAELRAKLAGSDVPALFTPYRSMRRA